MESAILRREGALKKWNRAWKVELIEKTMLIQIGPNCTTKSLKMDSRFRGNDGWGSVSFTNMG